MSRRLAAVLVLLLLSCSSSRDGLGNPGQPSRAADESSLLERARLLSSLALNEGQSHEMLSELTRVAPARLSGTPAADRAVEWAEASMKRLGLKNVRRERVMVPRWIRGDVASCSMILRDSEEELDIAALGGSIATPEEGISGEVLMVRSFEELRRKASRAEGKIIFFNRPMPRALLNTFLAYRDAVPQRSSGAAEAGRVGGSFALVRSMTTRIDDNPHTGAMSYEDGVPMVPTAAISTADANRLAALITAGRNPVLRIRLDCQSMPDVESANVVGDLPGSSIPEEIVLIGGHLDSWDLGAGAHDDGAGCVHSLEAVRLIQAAGLRPRRTIRVVLFMNEENGLRGGRAYARDHAQELFRHVAAIESDSGGFLPRGFSCNASGARAEAIREIVDELDPLGMGAYIPGGGGADIAPMGPAGVTLLGMVTVSHRYFDYHHSAIDNMDAVNERELALGAAAMAYMASALADANLPPEN